VTEEQLVELGEALEVLQAPSAVQREWTDLNELKEDMKETKKENLKESKAAVRLESRIEKMVDKLEKDLQDFDVEVGNSLNLIKPDKDGNITLSELETALNLIRHHPDQDNIHEIVAKFDPDNDGVVDAKQIIELAHEVQEGSVGEEEEKEKEQANQKETQEIDLPPMVGRNTTQVPLKGEEALEKERVFKEAVQ